MPDVYSTTTTQGFGSRIMNSFAGLIIGPLLIIAAIGLLWWNEGRAVQAIVGLNDAASQLVEAQPSGPSPANANKLVHVVGPATAQTPLRDEDVGITFRGQVSVQRNAEMYQWKEEKKEESHDNTGGSQTTTTTYSYSREWSADAIDSSDFKYPDGHQNPDMPFKSSRMSAPDAKLGGWKLDYDTLGRIDITQALNPDAPEGWSRSGGNYYNGEANAPKVGDMRVNYASLPSGTTVSVLALQSGEGFAPFTAKNGYTVDLAATGNHSATEMIENQRKAESTLTWILRGAGTLVMFMGFAAFLSPLSTIASFIPFLGSLVRGAAGFVSFVIAVPLSIVVMALAWFAYRPLLGGGLILLAAGIGYGLWHWHKTRSPHVPAPAPAKA